HHRIPSDPGALRVVVAQRSDLVASGGRDPYPPDCPLLYVVARARQGNGRCGTFASDRHPGVVGPPEEPDACLSEAARVWAISTFTPAHLRSVHADPMEGAHVDARPARRGGDLDVLLPDRAALQGRPLPPHLRHGLRCLRKARALLAPLAATGLLVGA